MKREIKFRAWDDGVMYHTDDYANENNYGEYDHLYFFFQQIRGDAKLMEFTGILDKNGKKIYEGDIVKEGDNKPNTVVFGTYNIGSKDDWGINTATTGFAIQFHDGSGYAGLHSFDACYGYKSTRIEVIGNIYEHKYLLENGQ